MKETKQLVRPIKELPYELARKIAAGEVIDRPAAVVRELIDNAIDSGATKIFVEIIKGGTERIRVSDNGCGMTEKDLALCTKTHSTSKINSEEDLLNLNTLGFRGEALSSIQAVSQLEITTTRNGREAWKLSLGNINPISHSTGTIVQVDGLFNNFPARKQFLKRPAAETRMCRQIFLEKALAWPHIEFRFSVDGNIKDILPQTNSFLDRCLTALNPKEPHSFFYSIKTAGEGFTAKIIIANPDVRKTDRKHIMTFVSGRRIYEYSLLHALSYGAEGYFPNGTFPFALCFIDINPHLVDFNIHPAKREARFTDSGALHHAIYTSVKNFYKNYTISQIQKDINESLEKDKTQQFIFDSVPVQTETHFFTHKTENPAAFHHYSIPEKKQYSEISDYQTEQKTKTYNFRYLGQVLGTFLAVEKAHSFYLIDQHAAHERILYNSYIAQKDNIQELLVPYRIETTSKNEDELLKKSKEKLASAGFVLEEAGNGLWHVTTVPASWKGTQKELVHSILDPILQGENLIKALYLQMACKAAAKDGQILDSQTACAIIHETFALEEAICPHGRPVWVKLSREELFKQVMRT